MRKNLRYCPRCTYPMTAVQARGTVVDHCHRCGGTAIEAHHISANVGEWADPKHWLNQLGDATTGERLVCPVDLGSMTGFQIPFGGRSVVVDHCDTCGTLWLDHGEGDKLVSIVRAATSGAHAPSEPARDTELEWRQDTEEAGGPSSYVFQLVTGLPIEVWNPVRGTTPATTTMLLVICVVFALQFGLAVFDAPMGEQLMKALGLTPALFLERPWGIVTYALLHGGLFHLLGNAYFLHVFGDNVEDRLGISKYLMLYLGASIVGGLLHLAVFPGEARPVVGASGAIAGLMGAYLMLFPRVKLWVLWFFMRFRIPVLLYFGLWVLMQVALAAIGARGIAWTAHLGGFAVGILAGWVWKDTPHPLTNEEARAVRR